MLGISKISAVVAVAVVLFVVYLPGQHNVECFWGKGQPKQQPIETVQVPLASLPRLFADDMMLRRGKRMTDHVYDHIGNIDWLQDMTPLDPFETGVGFYADHLSNRTKIEFKRTINCIEGSDVCQEYPFNLNQLLGVLDLNKRTIVIVGGYLAQAPTDWQLEIASRWRLIEDVNTIIVSWNKANTGLYHRAVANLPVVARQVTVFLHYLAELGGTSIRHEDFAENLYFVGHSLGAHISGLVGQDFDGKLGRITGLDPAAPKFKNRETDQRLDRSDAILVDVIHTNADDSWSFFLGLYQPIGHVDYYANNGKWQPSCKLVNFFSCNHESVKKYYVSVLDHALATKAHFDHETKEDHRLFGHLAESYEDFRSGHSIAKNCPLMDQNSNNPLEQNAPGIRNCVVPMDFVKPAREFRQELERDYNVNFGEHQTSNKYFFFTSNLRPYVNDHNLLKVKFTSDSSDQPNCVPNYRWQFKFQMDGGESSSLVFRRRDMIERNNPSDDSSRVVVPFLALTFAAKYVLSGHDRASDGYQHGQVNLAEILTMAKSVLPRTVDVSAGDEPKTAQEEDDYYRGDFGAPTQPPSCKASLESIRVLPLKKLRRTVVGIYTRTGEVQSEPKVRILKAGEQIPDMAAMPASGSSDASRNVKLYLDTVVIGPPRV